jgi:uncharacterized protein (DUF952 family)
MPDPIYHLVPLSELVAGLAYQSYTPARFREDGFVHCSAGRATTLAVATDYFARIGEPLLLLELDTTRLTHELRFEAPAPIPGGGRKHLEQEVTFPHLYGPVDRAAITGAAVLDRDADGYRWPPAFEPLDAALAHAASGDGRATS